MPTLVNAETSERDALLKFLEAQRGGLRRAVHGISDEQARTAPSASELSLAGLIKHTTHAERNWLRYFHGVDAPDAYAEEQFTMLENETLQSLLADHAAVAAETERVIRELPELEATFTLPDAPWFPPNSVRTARWLLLALIQEMSRHAGHADVIRETLDGATAFELVSATGEWVTE